MSPATIYEVLTEIVREVLMRDNIFLIPDLAPEDIEGWDSIRMIEILVATEDRFSIKIHSNELDNIRCVGDIARLVEAKTSRETVPSQYKSSI